MITLKEFLENQIGKDRVMFSKSEKQMIASKLEEILLGIKHPEMPDEKPKFSLHVDGVEGWSWADIEPNWMYDELNNPSVNSFNEKERTE